LFSNSVTDFLIADRQIIDIYCHNKIKLITMILLPNYLTFTVPPLQLFGVIAGILLLHVVTGDIIKVIFFKRRVV
jgi:hypothetical protein